MGEKDKLNKHFAIEEYFCHKFEKMFNEEAKEEDFFKVMMDDFFRVGTAGTERIMYLNNLIKRFIEQILPSYLKIPIAICDKDFSKGSLNLVKEYDALTSNLNHSTSDSITNSVREERWK